MNDAISYDARELPILAALEMRHFWFRVRRQIIVDALRRWHPAMRDYLEVGSGTGFVARRIAAAFPAARVIASDPLADGMLRLDARHMTAEARFDVVGAFDVLEHIDDDAAVLRRLACAVRPGGTVLLTVPQHPSLWSSADRRAGHFRRYTRADLLAKVRAAGLAPLQVTSFNTINLPLFALRLAMLARTGRDPAATTPLPPVNAALTVGMQADRWLIRAGISLPVGASLMVAARRPVA